MGARRVCLENVPPENIARQKISVRNTGCSAIEFEVAGGNVSPAGVVLVILVELTADLNRVPATDHCENIANVVNTLAQCGIYVSVSAGAGKVAIEFARAKTHCPG